jgi:hypothetical protein
MLPFIDSVACFVGDFDGQTCFAEAWLRATHNGEPTGAIAHFGSTISQSWAPPMAAEDETIDLLTHQYPENSKVTVGGIYYDGCMRMNDEYGADGYGETDYWTIFGDPSLQVRTATPEVMSVTHNVGIPIGSDFFDVTVAGIQGALCSLSRNGQLIGAAYTDATGFAHIVFPALEGADPIDLVVTAFNQQTYITSQHPSRTNRPNPDQRQLHVRVHSSHHGPGQRQHQLPVRLGRRHHQRLDGSRALRHPRQPKTPLGIRWQRRYYMPGQRPLRPQEQLVRAAQRADPQT